MKLVKHHQFTNDIILVDGMWGVGKSAITPIIASLKGIEKKRIDPIFEYVVALQWLNLMDDSAAEAIISTYADYFSYNNAIGREVNLRISDDSGMRNSPGRLRYLQRLFFNDGDHVQSQIDADNPGTLIVSDLAILGVDTLRNSLGSRLHIIEVVRHPLHLFTYHQNYLQDFNRRREFTLSLDFNGNKLPWIVRDWASEFVSLSLKEQALLLVARTQATINHHSRGSNLLVIPFEQFVTDTDRYVDDLTQFLGRPVHYPIRPIMRRHRLPRQSVSAGRRSNRRSWITENNAAEASIYKLLLTTAREGTRKNVWEEFLLAITNYEFMFPSALSDIGITRGPFRDNDF